MQKHSLKLYILLKVINYHFSYTTGIENTVQNYVENNSRELLPSLLN